MNKENILTVNIQKTGLAVLVMFLANGCTPLQHKGQRPALSDADVAAIPDAVPVPEPRSKRGNPSSYEVFGRTYYVMDNPDGFIQQGQASWYGPNFHGKTTSSGDVYDMYKMTAAHKTLPIPAYVRVVNLENGKSAVVRVNDRGPFIEGRVIDLSFVAAKKLDIVANGTAKVEIRVLDMHGNNNSEVVVNPIHDMQPLEIMADAPVDLPEALLADTPVIQDEIMPVQVLMEPAYSTPSSTTVTAVYTEESAPSNMVTLPLAAETELLQNNQTYFIQLGAFSQPGNAEKLRSKLEVEQENPVEVSVISISGRELLRVRSGPFYNKADAKEALRGFFRYPDAKIVME